MASVCISSCVKDARVPVRATYVNLYKWPESDAEFVRSMSSNSNGLKDGQNSNSMYGHPSVVESFSCRQLYLRSYTFSSNKNDEKSSTINCLGGRPAGRKRKSGGGRKKFTGLSKAKAASCSAFEAVFRRLLSCTTKIDVVN
ncbi:hypothetical protein ACJIZ3_012609 [Penstemon smallii]|uniref:Uncharacterized protein n=1 Tax=Penstemon smallii TaxID=265156 RepID=A0ABD3UMJ6_9LAMI